MATAVGLNMKITADTSGIGRGMTRTEKLLAGVDKNAQSAARSLRAIATIQVGGAVIKGLGSIVGTLTSAANAAVGYANSLRTTIDETAKLAARTGISVEALQGFQVAADLSGVQNLEGAIQRLTISIGDAASGVKEPQKAFARLGLDFERLAQLKPEDQFRAVAAAFQNVGSQAEKAAVAADLFGRTGVELLPLFDSNLAEIEARAQRLGIVLGRDQTAAIERMNDSLSLVRKTLDGILGQVLANIADVVTAISEEFLQFVEAFEGLNGAQGGNAIADLVTQSVLNGIESLLEVLRFVGSGLITFAETVSEVAAFFQNLTGGGVAAERRVQEAVRNRNEARQRLGNDFFGSDEDRRTERELRRATERARGINGDAARRVFDGAIDAAVDAANNVRQRLADAADRAPAVAAEDASPAFNIIEAVAKPAADFAKQKGLQIGAFAKGMFDGVVERFQEKQKQLDAIDKQITSTQLERAKRAQEIEDDRLDALSRTSNQALSVSDVRSGGISDILRIATGREDPAIEEYRKQLGELRKIDTKLGELRADRVEIAGNGARA